MTHLHETKESRPRRPLRHDDATPQPPQGLVQLVNRCTYPLPSSYFPIPATCSIIKPPNRQPQIPDLTYSQKLTRVIEMRVILHSEVFFHVVGVFRLVSVYSWKGLPLWGLILRVEKQPTPGHRTIRQ